MSETDPDSYACAICHNSRIVDGVPFCDCETEHQAEEEQPTTIGILEGAMSRFISSKNSEIVSLKQELDDLREALETTDLENDALKEDLQMWKDQVKTLVLRQREYDPTDVTPIELSLVSEMRSPSLKRRGSITKFFDRKKAVDQN